MTDFACSVIIPSFNHRRFVGAAIESALAQTLQPVEIVVIDDGSTDGSPDAIRGRFGDAVHVLEARENRGAADTINEGIARARAPYVAVLNSDDVHAPERLRRIVPWMARIAADVVFTAARPVDRVGAAADTATMANYRMRCAAAAAEDWRGALVEFNLALTTSNIVARKAAVAAVGGFRPFRYVHDWDFMLRSLSRLSVEWLDEPLCDYRVHGANTIGEVRDGPGRALLIAEQSLMAALFLAESAGTPMASRRERLMRAPDLHVATIAALAARLDREGAAGALAALREGRLPAYVDDALAASRLAPLRHVSVADVRRPYAPPAAAPAAGAARRRRKSAAVEMLRGTLRVARSFSKHVLRRDVAAFDVADHHLRSASDALGGGAGRPAAAAPVAAAPRPRAAAAGPRPDLRSVVLVSHVGYRGGASLILLSLARCLRRDFALDVRTILADRGVLAADFAALGAVATWPGTAPMPGPNGEAPPLPAIEALAARLDAHFAAEGIEPGATVALCNTIPTSRYAAAFARLGVPVIALIHEKATSFPPGQFDEIYRAAGRVIYPARLMLEAATSLPGFDPERSIVMPQDLVSDGFGALDPAAARAEVLAELGLGTRARIVLGSGPADFRKGFDLFVAAMIAVAPEARRHDMAFVWLGQETPVSADQRAWLARDLAAAGLTGRLHMVEHVPSPERFFQAADVFLLTSREDPFPCAAQEAMACRTPVICFRDAAGTQEILDDGRGIVVPYAAAGAMGAALVALLDDDARRAAMGEAARVFALDRFGRGAYARAIHRLAVELQRSRAP
ncbi:MAG: glycosyltransferase [Alphaproteobacteria bacterium]|nr:glycosyltransferase [Alphaproteobacteria bacterium]